MVDELSQVCLVQMVLRDSVPQVPVVIPARMVKYLEWAGRVVLPQQVLVLVPQEQVEEGQAKEVY